MSCPLSLSEEAQRSIKEQMQWSEADEKHGGAECADRSLDRLEAALNKLVASPHRQGMEPENCRWHPDLEICQTQFRPWKSGVGWAGDCS